MRFNSVRSSDYSQSARAVSKASDQIFDAAISGKPDFTKISKEAIKGRSLERRTATEAEGRVAQAGIKAAADVRRTRMKADTADKVSDIKRPAKRMAGVVAGLGAIAGAAVMMKDDKEEKADNSNIFDLYQGNIDRYSDKAADLRRQASEVNTDLPKVTPAPTGSVDSTDTSSTSASSTSSTIKPSGKGGLYSQSDIRSLAEQVGFSSSNAAIVSAIGMGESGGKAGIDTVQSGLDPGKNNEFSVGLLQINTQAHMDKLTRRGWGVEDLRDPLKNLTIAKEVFDEAGGSFKPWGAYTNGSYSQYLK